MVNLVAEENDNTLFGYIRNDYHDGSILLGVYRVWLKYWTIFCVLELEINLMNKKNTS